MMRAIPVLHRAGMIVHSTAQVSRRVRPEQYILIGPPIAAQLHVPFTSNYNTIIFIHNYLPDYLIYF